MALCDDCFQEFLHPLIHEGMAKNERFKEQYGEHARWDWDDEAVTLTFSDPVNATIQIDVTVVGTTQGDSWQWSWANRNMSAKEIGDMERVREFGEANGFESLTSKFLVADEYTGWEMTAVAAHVLEALGGYRFPTGHGYCYLIYRKIHEVPKELDDLWGAMEGALTIAPGVDITEPTGEKWKAESDDWDPTAST